MDEVTLTTFTLTTLADVDDWQMDANQPTYFLIDGLRSWWVLWGDEGGDWNATRPPGEDDDEALWGKGVSRFMSDLPLPLRIYCVPPDTTVLADWPTVPHSGGVVVPEPGGSR